MDQLYAQVDKKKQKSKEKEVCPEESGAVYSVVNKPSPPQVPTKSQELLEELANLHNNTLAHGTVTTTTMLVFMNIHVRTHY